MSPRRRDAPGPTSAARLADDLRRRILTGDLRPGEPLREEQLAADTGLSRHTVRTALAALGAERLVVAEPYRGARVTDFTLEDVIALQQLRAALEGEAVRLVRERHGDAWPASVTDPIQAAIERLERVDEADWPSVAAAHAGVHRAVVAAAGNPRFDEAYARLDSELLLLLVHLRPQYSRAGLVAQHRAHLEDIRAVGEPAVRDHLAASTRLLQERWAKMVR